MKKEEADYSYQGVGEFILEIIKIIALAFIIIVPIRVFLFQPFFVQGASMEPNFEDGQYLIINEFGFKETDLKIINVESFKNLERQQAVVFRYPMDPKKFFIKRIIGLPGEKIQIKNSEITIFNESHPLGFVLDEKEYIPSNVRTKGDSVVSLKDDQYFVLGDNRAFSSDSRIWGPVPKEDIIGEVLLRAWPLDKISVY
ncbi:MAG: signal peptidase I [Candidatus Moranbacteria bacterium RIFOXYA12_FULL_35_19]|nr:MAG: Signal peptidase I [Candidatus Moranbacteria bacterium GW2011_GWF2_35_39]OGI30807.1 MAG: signal peptidase I [Candidatus Moranbacteria bacterium RIFOXYB12_FULL_35_8]OGI33214.1 MAG: signal peptidase I [Candidatus Moranbacteria bacterium RIFOXYC12_FULL_36_13]OGI36624.1 MAG: signal peptidase I [Candidatus Moranbacteria bacterium RIFOXYA12_FULL_35_19]